MTAGAGRTRLRAGVCIRVCTALLLAVAALPLPAGADAMRKSLVPRTRPDVAQPVAPPAAAPGEQAAPAPAAGAQITPAGAIALTALAKPRPRPVGLIAEPSVTPPGEQIASAAPKSEPQVEPQSPPPMTPVLRPLPRPADLTAAPKAPEAPEQVAAAAPEPKAKTGLFGRRDKKADASPKTVKGSVCGDPAIRGEALAPIRNRVQGCGIEAPVRITAVDGVRLSQAATIDCDTAKALKTWINRGLRPAYGKREIVELKVAAHYICRPRNNVKGAKVSEHGRGRAIDIAGIVTSDGRTQMVAGGFDKTMRQAYRAGCGIFNTTLGPGSDGYHEDHMHFDTAVRQRGGAYCR